MERYQQLFKQLAAKKEGAFVPFVQLAIPLRRCHSILLIR